MRLTPFFSGRGQGRSLARKLQHARPVPSFLAVPRGGTMVQPAGKRAGKGGTIMDGLRALLASLQREEGQGIYIGAGTLVVILIIVLLLLLL